MIAVDHDPRTARLAQGRKLLDPIEDPPASKQHLTDEGEIVISASSGGEESFGEAVERLGRNALDLHPALLFPSRELPPCAVELPVAGEHSETIVAARGGRHEAHEEVVRVRRKSDRGRLAAAELARHMGP